MNNYIIIIYSIPFMLYFTDCNLVKYRFKIYNIYEVYIILRGVSSFSSQNLQSDRVARLSMCMCLLIPARII